MLPHFFKNYPHPYGLTRARAFSTLVVTSVHKISYLFFYYA